LHVIAARPATGWVPAAVTTPDPRPFPPGEYPVVVVGSGPGALQLSYSLRKNGVAHAVLSADPSPGGMFRRWPFFQRLLSWTKPYAPHERGTIPYERYDWNSLLPDEPELRSIQPDLMDGSSYFPSRPEMEANLVAFATKTGITVRYECRWTATRTEPGPDGDRFVLETTDGEYRTGVAIFAVGLAEPFIPPMVGGELVSHYADTRPAETYADRRIFIIGKQVSAFELATGLLPWARKIVLASPSPTKLSVNTRSLVGVRARYVQPYEDFVLGGGVSVLDASIAAVERAPGGTSLIVRTRATSTEGAGAEYAVEADDVISATGFVCPLIDLSALGVATFGQSRLPAQTPFWESATVPGIYFAGTITQGSTGLKKHGLPSNSGAVHGARYNARVLARHLATTRFGYQPERPAIEPADLLNHVLAELTWTPELWHQKAYLTRVISADPAVGLRDEGILPLAHILDAGGPDAIMVTLEADGTGAIYPVIYLRRDGQVEEHALEPQPLLDYETPIHRRLVGEVLARLVPEAAVTP
jgi:thioredoxin reductase